MKNELVSECCSAAGGDYQDIGICPECKEHTEFIDLDEIDELDYPEPSRQFSAEQQAIIDHYEAGPFDDEGRFIGDDDPAPVRDATGMVVLPFDPSCGEACGRTFELADGSKARTRYAPYATPAWPTKDDLATGALVLLCVFMLGMVLTAIERGVQ